MTDDTPKTLYAPIEFVLDYLLSSITPEQVFDWALTDHGIEPDWLCEFFGGHDANGKPRLNPDVPVQHQLGKHAKAFLEWIEKTGQSDKLIPVGSD